MRYPIAIEPGDETHAFGVIVPDLPGCYSAGDTLEEAHANAKKSAELWLEAVLEDGGFVPQPLFPESPPPRTSGKGRLALVLRGGGRSGRIRP